MAKHTSKEAYFERLKNLAEVNKPSLKESKIRNLGSLIDYKRAADGIAYGIVKENHNYYIKKSGIKQDPNVSDFVYIGGMENITGYQFKSLAEADKQRNMMFHTINEANTTKVSKTGSKKKLNEDVAGEEIDQATSKLGDLDAASSVEKMPTQDTGGEELPSEMPIPDAGEGNEENLGMDAGEEMPTPDTGGEELPVDNDNGEELPMDNAGEGDEENLGMDTGEDTDEPNKEIQKVVGKLTDKIRKTKMTDAQVKSYINSFITSFKDKLPKLEIEDRKEMANKLIKVVAQDEIDNLEASMPNDNEKPEGVEEQKCSECGGFAQYAESRGYNANSIRECGEEEVGNLVSGYANAHGEGQNDGDLENVALIIKIVNPEILNQLKGDYGHEEYADKLTPYVDGMNESNEEDDIAKLNELFSGGADPANTEISVPNMLKEDGEDDEEIDDVKTETGEELPFEKSGDKPLEFSPASQSLGVATVKPDGAPTTGVDINISPDKSVSISMSESEIKLRKYIRNRLEENAGLRKSTLNENKKSSTIKKFDALIDKQFKLYENTIIKKNKNINEVFGFSGKEKFAKLNPNSPEIVNLFNDAFRAILSNPKMGIIKIAANKTPINQKYEILQQYFQNNGGTLRLAPNGNGVIYAGKDIQNKATENPFGGGGTGGGNFGFGGTTGSY